LSQRTSFSIRLQIHIHLNFFPIINFLKFMLLFFSRFAGILHLFPRNYWSTFIRSSSRRSQKVSLLKSTLHYHHFNLFDPWKLWLKKKFYSLCIISSIFQISLIFHLFNSYFFSTLFICFKNLMIKLGFSESIQRINIKTFIYSRLSQLSWHFLWSLSTFVCMSKYFFQSYWLKFITNFFKLVSSLLLNIYGLLPKLFFNLSVFRNLNVLLILNHHT